MVGLRILISALALCVVALPSKGARTLPGPAPSDTLLVDSIRAGQVLIRALPDSLDGRPVERYEPARMPVTGWLVDRSFYWRAPVDAVGTHRFAVTARLRGSVQRAVELSITVGR